MLNRLSFVLAIPACNALCALPPMAEQSQPAPVGPIAAHSTATLRSRVAMSRTAELPAGVGLRAPSLVAPVVYAQPFIDSAQDDVASLRSLDCLTAAVYYEARSEPVEGQRAVAQVVLNRVRHPGFPSSVCGVVYQGSERSTGCQFSFTCDGSMTRPREPGAWVRAQQIAQEALDGSVDANVGLATYYHASSVLPWWAQSLSRVATVGTQIFYKWRGALGNALAFRQSYAGIEPAPAAPDSGQRPLVSSLPAQYSFANGATVDVHRGSDVAPTSFGVKVHVGGRASSERLEDVAVSTVTVHRGGVTREPDPT